MDELLVDTPAPGVQRLTLNRPECHNAVSFDLQSALDAALAEANADDGVRVIVLAGAGERAFSAGYDITELAAMDEADHTLVMLEREELLWRWFASPKPTVAALTGLTYGVGTLLAVCSDLRVGGPSTAMKLTATSFGGVNLSWLLDGLIGGSHARDILLTARVVSGDDAYRVGLLNRFVADHEVPTAAVRLAEEVAQHPTSAVTEAKRLLLSGPGSSLRSRYDAENTVMVTTLKPPPMKVMFAGFLGRRGDT